VVELVTAYLDGALAPADAARFEAHLDGCAPCRTFVAQFALTVNAVGALPPDEPDARTLALLLDAFRDDVRNE
jgi:anti-sigma factor RsiW